MVVVMDNTSQLYPHKKSCAQNWSRTSFCTRQDGFTRSWVYSSSKQLSARHDRLVRVGCVVTCVVKGVWVQNGPCCDRRWNASKGSSFDCHFNYNSVLTCWCVLQAVTALFAVPGASASMLDASVPYAQACLTDYLGGNEVERKEL